MMPKGDKDPGPPLDIRVNNSALLNILDAHFLVRVTQVSKDTFTVTFPGRDYPMAGMVVELEFHDEAGFNAYETQVVAGPNTAEGTITLRIPEAAHRNQHRLAYRVPTDLTAQIKDQIHVRRYDAFLLDLSPGGALVSTHAEFSMDTTVELFLSLPLEPPLTLLAQVVHLSREETGHGEFRLSYGLRFVGLTPPAEAALRRYCDHRFKELYRGR